MSSFRTPSAQDSAQIERGLDGATKAETGYFFAAASLMAFRCGSEWSSSWHAASVNSNLSRLKETAIVNGRV